MTELSLKRDAHADHPTVTTDSSRSNDHEPPRFGVIFLFLKFCDPHAFDYPYLRARLDEAGIPSLLVELEEHTAADGQLRTRVEAFMEMLKTNKSREAES